MFDPKVARGLVYAAIDSYVDEMERREALRPSSCGYCLRRLWFQQRAIDAGEWVEIENPDERAKRQWMSMQGTLSEHLVRPILRKAGAEVLDPKFDDPEEEAERFRPDPVTGMVPHADGAIRWPAAGLEEWNLLELKSLRATGAIPIMLDGVRSERSYWYQLINYLGSARSICENNDWDITPPTESLFLLTSKDPSVVKMLMNQRITPNKKERETPEKLKEDEFQRFQLKKVRIARLEETGDPTAFYFEHVKWSDAGVREVWDEILTMPGILAASEPPDPLHNPMLHEDALDMECKAYCGFADLCRQHLLQSQLKNSVGQAFDNFEKGLTWDSR